MTQWFGGEEQPRGQKHEHHHDHHDCDEIIRVLRGEIAVLLDEIKFLRTLIVPPQHNQLSSIKISFGGIRMLGPVTLSVGQKTTATVQGFDQNGAAMQIDFTANPVTWAVDNAAIATSEPQADQSSTVTAVSGGVANLTATCAGLSDTETVTVTAVIPVLSSIKVDFTTPA